MKQFFIAFRGVLFTPFLLWTIGLCSGADLNQPGVMVQVNIQENTKHGRFNDCLYYGVAEFQALPPAQLAAAKKARVDNWVAFVDAQSSKAPVEPTKEDVLAQTESVAVSIDATVESLLKLSPTKPEKDALAAKLQATVDKLKSGKATVVEEVIK